MKIAAILFILSVCYIQATLPATYPGLYIGNKAAGLAYNLQHDISVAGVHVHVYI